jgi:hypothetical protein
MTFSAGAAFDVNAVGAVTIDSSGGSISIGADSVNQSINIGTNGNRFITIGSANNTSFVDIKAGKRGVNLGVDAISGTRGITYVGYNRTASSYTDGALLAFQVSPSADHVSPQFVLASAASGAATSIKQVNGISSASLSVASGSPGLVCVVAGTMTPVQFAAGAAPSGSADIGKPVYLSTTAGQATLTAPTGSGETIFRIGYLSRGVSDANGNWFVQFQPQFIGLIP